MISDFVKGKNQFTFPKDIHKGIVLHRAIDTFTDNHPEVKKAKQVFRPVYRLYAGAFIDVAFDHFLANDNKEFVNKEMLANFSRETYTTLSHYENTMPERFRKMFRYMKEQDWLYNYHHLDGIRSSFEGLVRRSTYLNDASAAHIVFENHYAELQNHYYAFFEDVKNFAIHHLQNVAHE